MVSRAEDDPLSDVEREFLNASVRTAPREDGHPPAPFDLRPFSMGRFDVRPSAHKASDALAVIGRRRSRRLFDDANARELADVLYFGARVRDFWNAPDGFLASSRPAPSAGGRHPVEIFVLSNRVRGLDSGVWWFDAFQSSLELLPLERFRPAVNARASELLGGKAEQPPAAILTFVGVLSRSASRYEQSLGLILKDVGCLTGVLSMVAEALSLPSCPLALSSPFEDSPCLGLSRNDTWLLGGLAIGGAHSVQRRHGAPDRG